MAFKKPNAAAKPTLINVGTMQSFGELVKSKTDGSPYYMEDVKLKGQGGSQDAKFRLMWAPEFMEDGFDPSSHGKGVEFVFKKNITSLDGGAYLEGLCGLEENFEALEAAVKALPDQEPETIHDLFKTFFSQLGPVPVIYVLKQERKQQGVDENDKKVYVNGPYYEVDQVLYLNEKNIKSLVKRVEANQKKIASAIADGKTPPVKTIFKFDPTSFGFDVEVPQEAPAWV